MLTIKIIQDGVTSITESNSFVFYDETSREYKEMLRLADKLKEKPTTLNGIYYTQPMYGDQGIEKEIAYSLIGTGDHIYVTNEQGKTVFNI